jgi:GntR family transcriptional regulator
MVFLSLQDYWGGGVVLEHERPLGVMATRDGAAPPLDGDIDRESPIPVYFQLALLIEAAIREERWPAGMRLPSELEMCRHYGLSRTTVRRTLGWLEDEGLIARRKGASAFVLGVPSRAWVLSSTSGFFEEEAIRMGHQVTSEILRAEIEPLPPWASGCLGLSDGARGGTLERVREVDGRKAIYVVNHVVPQYAEAANDIGPDESLYLRLRDRFGVESHGGRRTLTARAATAEVAALLDLERGHPVVFIESVQWDRSERPFDCYRAWVVSEIAPVEIRVASVAPKGRPD